MPITSVVVADDEFLNRDLMEEIFTRLKIDVRVAKDGVHALRCLEERPADLLISDIRMPGMGGMRLLKKVREQWPEIPVVMMTAYASVESAVESMRQGAYDYLMKPFTVEHVEALLLRLNERQQLVSEVKVLREEVRDRHKARDFLGESTAMESVFGLIERAASSNATVLVRGESGTGKELVARALHEQSTRANGPFIKVNCAALTETLLASELFGHERGSFTGAEQQHIGRFELAHGGTLLLDEISEISPELQAKLLRVLEEQEFERVGGSQVIRTDVRVVATSNRDLEESCKRGDFREDLFYRLNVIPVDLPPLRDRKGDVALILNHYLQNLSRDRKQKTQITDDARRLLLTYDWPGNVRELVNISERLVVLYGDEEIDEAAVRRCLPELQREDPVLHESREVLAANLAANIAEEPDLGLDVESTDTALSSLADLEREHILRTLDHCDNNKQEAADILGISLRTLWNRLSKYQQEEADIKK